MKLHELTPAVGAVTPKWRKGRGPGSGNGKTAGKGHKGQNARSGGGVRPGFEGGQNPLYRKLPKRGFHNNFSKHYAIVNISALDRFENNAVVDLEALMACGLVGKAQDGLKILANGEISKALTVRAAIFTAAAKAKIEAAGGKCEVV